LQRIFQNAVKRKRVNIDLDVPTEVTWQFAKINLILSLSGTSDLYMDSDLRWNGALPVLSQPMLYVHEFQFSEFEEFSYFYQSMLLERYPKATMSNTSFVYFHNFELTPNESREVEELFYNINRWAENSDIGESRANQIQRLSEQIALSVVLNNYIDLIHLKSTDKRSDGQFVESSYFGATGLDF